MARFLPIVGWLLVALDLVMAAVLLFGRKSGDAATRAFGPGFGAALLFVGIIAAALLLWGGRGEGRTLIVAIGGVFAAIPLVLAIALAASPQSILGLIYPSMRQREQPMEEDEPSGYPDAAGREAADALNMNNYAKLDTLLRATPAPDLTAHDGRGVSLVGMATNTALMGGATMRDLAGLRLVLAAGGRPRPDDLGRGRSLLETVAGFADERAFTVLKMLLDAGLAPDTPMRDGRSVLFLDDLTADAAKQLLARGVKTDGREKHTNSADWSPVTYHTERRHWATALALLEGGVPRDYGTPEGSVLQRVLRDGEEMNTDADRNDPAFKAFMVILK